MKIILTIMLIILFNLVSAQDGSTLYQDDHVKVTFKKINERYAYLIEDYENRFGGTLVEYKIENDTFFIKELDTIIIVDSIVFLDRRKYKQDSLMLSLKVRVNEFSGLELSHNHLKYIVNDSLEFDGTKMYDKDQFHRALIPQISVPYKLEVEAGKSKVGPFIIERKNDVSIKLVALMTSLTDEFDYGKDLPSNIRFEGVMYKLKHNFIAWN